MESDRVPITSQEVQQMSDTLQQITSTINAGSQTSHTPNNQLSDQLQLALLFNSVNNMSMNAALPTQNSHNSVAVSDGGEGMYMSTAATNATVPGLTPMTAQLSMPMSLLSSGSYHQPQMPYITSTPTVHPMTMPMASISNVNAGAVNMNMNMGHMNQQPINMNMNMNMNMNHSVFEQEQYWKAMRRTLNNILLLLFRYHPNGVLECELSQFYEAMFNESLCVKPDLLYMLTVHKSVTVTECKERGPLYTLNDDKMDAFLREFELSVLQPWIRKHIRRLFRCFPNGIACSCLLDLLFNMVEFHLSSLVPQWEKFVWNIPDMHCITVEGVRTFICVELQTLNEQYRQLRAAARAAANVDHHGDGDGDDVNDVDDVSSIAIDAHNAEFYLTRSLKFSNTLQRPVGYCELLIATLAPFYTDDTRSTFFQGIDGDRLEDAFHRQYNTRLVHEAPFIQRVLGHICRITQVASATKKGGREKLYKLSQSSKQYFDEQPDAFTAVLARALELQIPHAAVSVSQSQNQNQPVGSVSGSRNVPGTGMTTVPLDGSASAQSAAVETGDPNDDGAAEVLSPFKEDHVSVFMGGFHHGTTVEMLRAELLRLGITMVATSGISYRNYGFAFVTLRNANQAQYLLSVSPLTIGGRTIDVRPFINRRRVRDHISNKPSPESTLQAMVQLCLQNRKEGLTVADLQSRLFRKFQYRIDGPELTKIVAEQPRYLTLKRMGTERIFATPKIEGQRTLKDVKSKIAYLWPRIAANYRGNPYAGAETTETTDMDAVHDTAAAAAAVAAEVEDDDDAKTAPEAEGDGHVEETPAALTVKMPTSECKLSTSLSNTSSSKSKSYKLSLASASPMSPVSPTSPLSATSAGASPTSVSVSVAAPEKVYTHAISVADFENEFARTFRVYLDSQQYGYLSMKTMVETLLDELHLLVRVVEIVNPLMATSTVAQPMLDNANFNTNSKHGQQGVGYQSHNALGGKHYPQRQRNYGPHNHGNNSYHRGYNNNHRPYHQNHNHNHNYSNNNSNVSSPTASMAQSQPQNEMNHLLQKNTLMSSAPMMANNASNDGSANMFSFSPMTSVNNSMGAVLNTSSRSLGGMISPPVSTRNHYSVGNMVLSAAAFPQQYVPNNMNPLTMGLNLQNPYISLQAMNMANSNNQQ